MPDNDIEQKIKEILKCSEPNNDREHVPATVVTAGGYVDTGRDMMIDQGGTILINDRPHPDKRIDEDQRKRISDNIETLVELDGLIGPALNPQDLRTHDERRESTRRRLWRAFRNAFRLKSFTHLTMGQYGDALQWLDQQKHAMLDALAPQKEAPIRPKKGQRNQPLKRSLRLVALLLVALAVPLMFSVSRTQASPTIITGQIAAVAVGPVTRPLNLFIPIGSLTVVPCQSGFHVHAAGSFLRAIKSIEQHAAAMRPDI